ncbi:MAG: DUF5996 family protein [Acidimicrobiia bacterium]
MTAASSGLWPALPYAEWRETLALLQLEAQVLGKLRVACSPREPEWAHITLYVSARGLTTGPVPVPTADGRVLVEAEADLRAHEVVVRSSLGDAARVAMAAPTVAVFHAGFLDALASLGATVELAGTPQEVADPVPFADDDRPREYDGAAATRFHTVLASLVPVFDEFRGAFAGRASRTQFFWGSMDLNVTRFTGEPGSADQYAAGFWPGSDSFPEPAFYAYAAPKPDGIEVAGIEPAAAAWDSGLGEFVLRYDDVRAADDPAAAVREFLDSTYAAAAAKAGWDGRLLA